MVRIQHDGRTRRFIASRVAWLLHNGQWPLGPVEHRNGDDFDFSEENLIERRRFAGTAWWGMQGSN